MPGEQNKVDIEELNIAVRLRIQMLLTVAWIAAQFPMGSVDNLNSLLYQ